MRLVFVDSSRLFLSECARLFKYCSSSMLRTTEKPLFFTMTVPIEKIKDSASSSVIISHTTDLLSDTGTHMVRLANGNIHIIVNIVPSHQDINSGKTTFQGFYIALNLLLTLQQQQLIDFVFICPFGKPNGQTAKAMHDAFMHAFN